MVISLEQGADLHMAQLMPLPLTVSCFSKIQIGFTFLVPAHPGSPGKGAVKSVCVCVWAGTRKAKPIWILMKQETVASAGPYASLHLAPDRQPHRHPTTQFFYRPDALPAAKPTASKLYIYHCKQHTSFPDKSEIKLHCSVTSTRLKMQ